MKRNTLDYYGDCFRTFDSKAGLQVKMNNQLCDLAIRQSFDWSVSVLSFIGYFDSN